MSVYQPPPPPATGPAFTDLPPSTFSASLIAAVLSFVGLFFCVASLRSCYAARHRDDEEASRNQRCQHRRRGLDKLLIQSFPTISFSQEHAKERECESYRQCLVCLSEYEVGEAVKTLPACGHRFHSSCIDMWLEGKVTCPICRTSSKPKRTSPVSSEGDSCASPETVSSGCGGTTGPVPTSGFPDSNCEHFHGASAILAIQPLLVATPSPIVSQTPEEPSARTAACSHEDNVAIDIPEDGSSNGPTRESRDNKSGGEGLLGVCLSTGAEPSVNGRGTVG